jgi:hypothetical protein
MAGEHMRGLYKSLLIDHVGATKPNWWTETVEFFFGVVAGPVTEAYPQLTPELWARMRCREGRRCVCDYCQWDERNRKRVDDWQRAQSLRPQPQKPYPFGSDADAASKLEAYARDGATAPSCLGPCLDRVRDEAALGARVVRAPGSGRDPAGIYHAGLRADVHRSYIAACSSESVRQGASTADTIRVTLAVQLGHEVGEEHAALAKRGRWRVRVELAARELTPPPPAKAARMARAVEARREELATRRVG